MTDDFKSNDLPITYSNKICVRKNDLNGYVENGALVLPAELEPVMDECEVDSVISLIGQAETYPGLFARAVGWKGAINTFEALRRLRVTLSGHMPDSILYREPPIERALGGKMPYDMDILFSRRAKVTPDDFDVRVTLAAHAEDNTVVLPHVMRKPLKAHNIKTTLQLLAHFNAVVRELKAACNWEPDTDVTKASHRLADNLRGHVPDHHLHVLNPLLGRTAG